MEIIFSRHSVRKYTAAEVEQEKIDLMLKAGMSAPSACNQQAWEFYVVKDKAKLDELSKCSPFGRPVRQATLAIVLCYRREGLRAGDFVIQDMSAATENILLEAHALGLGAVWIGIAPVEKRMQMVADVLNVPESLAAFNIISIGYPDEKFVPKDHFDAARVHYV